MNSVRRHLGGGLLAVLLLVLVAGVATAAPIPATMDYHNATTPMITGTVIALNPQDIRVATEQGDEALLTTDSHSIVPADLRVDMMVRIQFHYLDDGSRHVDRVIPLRGGDRTTREMAYSREVDEDRADRDDRDARYAAMEGSDEPRHHHDRDYTHDGRLRVTSSRTIPSTHGYDLATRPTIAGWVDAVNDQRIMVETENGPVTVQMDSRTLVPSTLHSGMGVRVDYQQVENGDFVARRITEDRHYAAEHLNRSYVPAEEGEEEPEFDRTSASREERAHEKIDHHPAYASNERTNTGTGSRLPDTAGPDPWFAVFGMLSLGAGWLVQRRGPRL
jgi:hypothetical protein